MTKSVWQRWQLGFLTAGILAVMIFGLSLRSKPPSIHDFVDEGGAPSEVRLQLRATTGQRFFWCLKGQARFVGTVKMSQFVCYSNAEVTDVTGGHYSSEATFHGFRMLQDDLNIESAMKREFDRRATATCDARGNILKTNSPEPLASYNFPTRPVRPGAQWLGYERSDSHRGPLKFTLEKIIRWHGRNFAIIRRDYPASSHQTTHDWIDLQKCAAIKCVEHIMRRLPDGRTLEVTADQQCTD